MRRLGRRGEDRLGQRGAVDQAGRQRQAADRPGGEVLGQAGPGEVAAGHALHRVHRQPAAEERATGVLRRDVRGHDVVRHDVGEAFAGPAAARADYERRPFDRLVRRVGVSVLFRCVGERRLVTDLVAEQRSAPRAVVRNLGVLEPAFRAVDVAHLRAAPGKIATSPRGSSRARPGHPLSRRSGGCRSSRVGVSADTTGRSPWPRAA